MTKIGKRLISMLAVLAVTATAFTAPVYADEDEGENTNASSTTESSTTEGSATQNDQEDPLIDTTETGEEDDGTITVEIEVPGSWKAGNFDVQVDGVPVSYTDGSGSNKYRLSIDENSGLITAILYNGDIDSEKNYPEHMRVYEIGTKEVETNTETDISEEDGEASSSKEIVYEAKHLEAFDDALEYVGFSIRAQSKNVKSGMRFSSSILSSVRNNAIESDDYTYVVEEYGNIHILSRNWNDDSKYNMVFKDGSDAIRGKCFVRDSMDKIIRRDNEGESNERIVFANTLTDIKDFNVSKNFRSYIRLTRRSKETRSAGEEIYLYGPSAGRSPYYIASKLIARGTEKNKGILSYSNMIVDTVTGTSTGSETGNTNENNNTNNNTNNSANVAKRSGYANANNNTNGLLTTPSADPATTPSTDPATTPSTDPATTPAASEKAHALFIGDSVMLGTVLNDGKVRGRGLPRNLSTDYTETHCLSQLIGSALANELGKEVECKLVGNGGATYSRPGVNLRYMQDITGGAIAEYEMHGDIHPDYIFLLAGVNDWTYTDQGEGEDGNIAVFGNPNTSAASEWSYCGGIVKTLAMLTHKYPDSQIVVCSPLRAWMYSGYGSDPESANHATGKTLKQYAQAQGVIVDRYKADGKKVNFVNLYDEILSPMGLPDRAPQGNTEINNYLNYFPDGYHPSRSAYEVVKNVVINDMKSMHIL